MTGVAAGAGLSNAGSAALSRETGRLTSKPRDTSCDGHASADGAAGSGGASSAGDTGSCGMGAESVSLCGEKLVTFGVGSGTLGVGSTKLGAGSGYCGEGARLGGGSTALGGGSTALGVGSTKLGVGSAGGRRHNGWAGGAAGVSIAGGSTAVAVLRSCGGTGGALADAASRYACVGVLERICDEGVDTAHSRLNEVFASVSGFLPRSPRFRAPS